MYYGTHESHKSRKVMQSKSNQSPSEKARRISDLAVEDFGFSAPLTGIMIKRSTSYGFEVISSERDEGEFHTIVAGRIWENDSMTRRALVRATAEQLTKFTKTYFLTKIP